MTNIASRSRAPKVPSTVVLMVRHGQTPTTGSTLPGRAPGLHLADEGHSQAAAVAERLSRLQRVDGLYTSPLERARETARPLGKELGLRVRTDRGLLECDFGSWTGRTLKELSRLDEWTAVQRYPSGFRFPHGESFTEMQARITGTLARLVERHRGGVVVAVSHADPIKSAVADALGTHLDLFQRILVSPCSITAVRYGPAGPSVLTVNSSVGRLEGLKEAS